MQKNAVDGERCKKCGAIEDVIEVTLELEMRSADVQYDLLGRPKSVTWNWENCSID